MITKQELQKLKKPANENQGWAATFTNENSGQTAGFGSTGGMTATYQQRYNQPVDESVDYIVEACKK